MIPRRLFVEPVNTTGEGGRHFNSCSCGVLAKPIYEPISDCCELNESEKRDGEPFVYDAEAAATFETVEDVFNVVTPPVVTAVKDYWPAASMLRGDSRLRYGYSELAEVVSRHLRTCPSKEIRLRASSGGQPYFHKPNAIGPLVTFSS